MEPIPITNHIIKEIRILKNPKTRHKIQKFFVEGLKFVRDIKSPYEILYFVINEKISTEQFSFIKSYHQPIYMTDSEKFKHLSDTMTPQGVLCVIKNHHYEYNEKILNKKNAPFFLFGENIRDPGNLGTAIRTASASNCDGILLSKGSVDAYNPKTIRATAGTLFNLPIYQNLDIKEVFQDLKRNNIKIYSGAMESNNLIYDLNLKQSFCFLVGNEGKGLSPFAIENSDQTVAIPMPGMAESLNATVAASIFLYEAVRQRLN